MCVCVTSNGCLQVGKNLFIYDLFFNKIVILILYTYYIYANMFVCEHKQAHCLIRSVSFPK